MKRFFAKLKLFPLRFAVSFRTAFHYLQEVFYYYRHWRFFSIDQALLRRYWFKNPYRINRDFLQEKGAEDLYTYGETPLVTLEHIVKECDISQEDYVFEMGSGRGRSCFWLHYFVGCFVLGIEIVPEFVRIAQDVKEQYGVDGVEFVRKDFLEQSYEEATVIYYYGTCAQDEEIAQLVECFKKSKPGTKIITVSYPLSDYDSSNSFKLVKTFPATFTWGEGIVYLQVRY